MNGRHLLLTIGPNDFSDAENADRIVESSHKNGIYCITRNVTEFAQFWMDTTRPVTNDYFNNRMIFLQLLIE